MAATDLLTLAEARAAVGIAAGVTTHDDQLQAEVSAVSAAIESLCGPVVIRTVTETLDPRGGTVFLTQHPVASVTTVTEYVSGTGTALTAESTTVQGGYRLVPGGMLERRSGWAGTAWSGPVTVTYEAGRYASTAAVAMNFKSAAKKWLRYQWIPAHAAGTETFGPASLGVLVPTIDVPRTVLSDLRGELLGPVVA